jgi:CDP-6-deoxy-D-xylo-4-hexulose-3-dehydrase
MKAKEFSEQFSPTIAKNITDLMLSVQAEMHQKQEFKPGLSDIPVTGKVFGTQEIEAAIAASIEFWLTSGPRTIQFEKELCGILNSKSALMVNSGSSANLLAITALTSNKLGSRAIQPGDEIVTVAAGFPTTVAPIIQNGLIPVYVDVDLGTYVAKNEEIEKAITPKTKAIMMAHTLGNPFDLDFVKEIADKHNLWLIEDNCDALGGTYCGKPLGSFGDLSTLSFYPAHHITTGEGGAVIINKKVLHPIVESFRDWGRDCWCPSGCDNTCAKRFEWELGDLPKGYDHKYIYSHLGYNLKSGEIQAAIGFEQLKRLPLFINKRKENWKYLLENLKQLEEFLILPSATEKSDPSWFGFALTVRNNSPVKREEIIKVLNTKKIGTRLLFGGNLLKQPAFKGKPARVVGSLTNTEEIMKNTFWIGVWPGLEKSMLDYMIDSLKEIFREYV